MHRRQFLTFNMKLNEVQDMAYEMTTLIDGKMKGEHDSDTTIIHIYEEIGEISRQLYNKKIGRMDLDKDNLAEEIVDAVMLLLHLSKVHNIDMEKEVQKKLAKLKQRHSELDWKTIGL